MLLAAVAFLWFCYVTMGVFVAIGGPQRAPQVLVRLFDPTHRVATTAVRRVGVAAAAALSVIIGSVPEAALVREVLTGRTSTPESVAITLGLMGCIVWLGFMSLRYRSPVP